MESLEGFVILRVVLVSYWE